MARKAAAVTIEHESPSTGLAALTQDQNQLTERSQEVMALYGEGLPYDRIRVMHEARFYMSQSAEAMLEAGKRLIILKEHEPHGDWMHALQELGIEYRLAARTMQAAIRFSNVSTSTHLIKAAQSKSKLFELMVLDDEELEALADGGTVAGITLDDVEKMPVSKLRAELRKAREQAEDTQRILEDKNKKIDDQAKKLTKVRREPPSETSIKLRADIAALTGTIDHDLRVNLYNSLNAVREHDEEHEIPHPPQDFIKAQIEQLEAAIALLRRDLLVGVEWEQ